MSGGMFDTPFPKAMWSWKSPNVFLLEVRTTRPRCARYSSWSKDSSWSTVAETRRKNCQTQLRHPSITDVRCTYRNQPARNGACNPRRHKGHFVSKIL